MEELRATKGPPAPLKRRSASSGCVDVASRLVLSGRRHPIDWRDTRCEVEAFAYPVAADANAAISLARSVYRWPFMARHNAKNALLIDLTIAAVIAALVLIVAPGLAIVGMVALLALIVGAASLVIELKHARRRSRLGFQENQ